MLFHLIIHCPNIIVQTLDLNFRGWKTPFTMGVEICQGLVINSEMTWWLSSPFLVLLRWHILLPGHGPKQAVCG